MPSNTETPAAALTDAEILRALVHRDGKTRTAANLETSEASVYRWLNTGGAPIVYRAVKALREQGVTLTAEQVAAWRAHEAADRRQRLRASTQRRRAS